jgi:hypothetical protein
MADEDAALRERLNEMETKTTEQADQIAQLRYDVYEMRSMLRMWLGWWERGLVDGPEEIAGQASFTQFRRETEVRCGQAVPAEHRPA